MVWKLCDGSGWQSTMRLKLDRYAHAALSVRRSGVDIHRIADDLRVMNARRIAEKGKPMSDNHVKQEAVKRGTTRLGVGHNRLSPA